jgi:anaerobic selenocysteine-containing dehydrogenase
VQDKDFVELTSRRGKLAAQARITAEIASDTCFVPFHWRHKMSFTGAPIISTRRFDVTKADYFLAKPDRRGPSPSSVLP